MGKILGFWGRLLKFQSCVLKGWLLILENFNLEIGEICVLLEFIKTPTNKNKTILHQILGEHPEKKNVSYAEKLRIPSMI